MNKRNLVDGNLERRITLILSGLPHWEEVFLEESNRYENEYSKEAFAGALLAWDYAKQNRVSIITPQYVKDINFILMTLINQEGGEYRREKCVIELRNKKGRVIGTREDTYPPEKIGPAMNEWCKRFNDSKTSEEEIKEEHVKFLKIHPFADGNGRTGRILMNIQRLNSRYGIMIVTKDPAPEGAEIYGDWFK